MAKPTPNLDLLRRVLRQIDSDPDRWNQYTWGCRAAAPQCGTSYCVGGWACVLAKQSLVWDESQAYHVERDGKHCDIHDVARDLLGLTGLEADTLFDCHNKRGDIEHIAQRIAARAGEPLWPEEARP